MNETRKVFYRTRQRRACEATPIGLLNEPKESFAGTKTCVAPRHMDTSRGALLFSLLNAPCVVFYFVEHVWGGGGLLSQYTSVK